MTFLFYKNNGTFGITSTDIGDILAEVQPEDIIDGITEIGIKINSYFENIAANIDYILWINHITEKVELKAYITVDGLIAEHETIEDDVEEFKISPKEICELMNFVLIEDILN